MANTLDVDERTTYAATFIETWRIIKFFLNDLKPTNIENLEPEDRKCAIFSEDFTPGVHRAVRLPCNHKFGEICIKQWLRPYLHSMSTVFPDTGVGANTCPTCRRVLFPAQTISDLLPLMETRIQLWDTAYAHLGIALSEREHQAREDLLQYLHSNPTLVRAFGNYFPAVTAGSRFPQWAFDRLLAFCIKLKAKSLTPTQEHLRQGLEDIARREDLKMPG